MPILAAAERIEGWSLASLLAEHVEDLRVRRRSITAQERAQHVLSSLFLYLREESVCDPRAVTEEHLVRFARKLGTQGLALHSRAAYLGAVKRFFAFLAKRGRILVDPARELPLPKIDRLPRRVLSEAQARGLMAAPCRAPIVGLRDRAILETLYGTGLRAGECRRLDLTDLDLSQEMLLVRDGKGRKDRVVPVLGRAVVALDVYLRDSRPEMLKRSGEAALFLARLGTRVSRSLLDVMVRTHGRAAGIRRPVSAHVLRHSCATHLLRGGADIRQVQELLGHRSLQTTQLYTRVDVQDLRRVLARAHPRERSWPGARRR